MILSRGRRYIFIHIPKTGGTALTLALEARAMKDDVIVGDTPKARARKGRLRGVETAGRLWKHSTLRDIRGLASEEEIASFFTFTLVRNPWDRMVSYYHWLKAQRFAHPAVAMAKTMDFNSFLSAAETRSAIGGNPYPSYVTDAAGKERCKLFLRLEHFEADAAPLESHLGFRVGPLALANPSDRARDWRGYYSDAAAAIVAEVCAPDIARFGYCFDP